MAGIFCFYKVVKSTWIQVEFHLIYATATVTSGRLQLSGRQLFHYISFSKLVSKLLPQCQKPVSPWQTMKLQGNVKYRNFSLSSCPLSVETKGG